MEVAPDEKTSSIEGHLRPHAFGYQALWFIPHLAAVYAIVNFFTPWLAGWTRGTLLPLLQQPTDSGRFEFLFSHILAFSFIPSFFCGLLNTRFKQTAAQFVWIVPTIILFYKYLTFPAPSVFASRWPGAFHYYFGGGFLVPEFHDFHEMFQIAGSNSDMARGMAQLTFTAPFYAAIGYGLAAWIGCRTELNRKFAERFKEWEESKFKQQA